MAKVQKAAELLLRATERKTTADAELSAAHAELRELQRLHEEQAVEDHDPDEDGAHNLAEYVQELIDALEDTPTAKTARVYAAANPLRTIAYVRANEESYGEGEGEEEGGGGNRRCLASLPS